MTYRIVVDALVLKKDFCIISLQDQKRIIRTIRQKLATRPRDFGKPLKGELKGFWKLRVGQFRVIYEIRDEQVLVAVILVGFRRNGEVYQAALARLGLD